MVEFAHFSYKVDTSGYTLIIPSVSVGNVGQLTVDLIISTHNLKRVATIWHPGLIPLVGGDPYSSDPKEISTACELYASEDLKLAVLQLRSSIEFKLALRFFNDLKEFISKQKFRKLIILSSTFAFEQHDVQSNPFRYVGADNGEVFPTLNVRPMEPDAYGGYVVQGSGFAFKLYEILKDRVQSTVLIKYVSEGDNRPDAMSMLDLLHRLMEKLPAEKRVTVKFPSSWQYVFGNPPPVGMY